ncbi:hypothetical protein Sste5346_008542 [Sporothrix stenoceras]|uniref:CBM-cenC domain-containing protein n=1 Tax=Sporothrix stenoceras TaxID=5173 RepID=A0ABR3YPU6_9PEZI
MKLTGVLATLLAGCGLAAASNCRPSVHSSASSAAPSSVSVSSSVPSASPSVAPCVPSTENIMAAHTDMTTSGWFIDNGPNSGATSTIETCDNGATNGCLHYTSKSSNAGYTVELSYTASTTPGKTYVFETQIKQSTAAQTTYIFYTGNSGSIAFLPYNTANEWVTLSLKTTAALSVTDFWIVAQPVDPLTEVWFSNFGVYEGCPDGPDSQRD